MSADPEVLRGLLKRLELAVDDWNREYNDALAVDDGPHAWDEVVEISLADVKAAIAALRAPQNDGAAATEWRPELVGADRLGRDRKGDVTINVPTALCWLQFRPGCSTGTDEQTRPGVGFSLVAYPDSHGEWPSGVIPRDEATKLYDMLGRFLAQPDPSQEPGTGGEE